jgi:hypothetical protein
MTEAVQSINQVNLADVYRHVHDLGRTPEDAKSAILDEMLAGRLQHSVVRTIAYLPRGASLSKPSPNEVRQNEPMPAEILTIGVAGRGALHIDWQNSKATRQAGCRNDVLQPEPWPRIEFEGIHCSREDMLKLWPAVAERPAISEDKRRGGSKPKYDWDATGSECFRRLHDDGVPSNRSEFGRGLSDWYNNQFGRDTAPDAKTLAPYLNKWIAAFERSLPRDD